VAWGWDADGQANVPSSNARFVDIAAGGAFSVALRDDGAVIGWGNTPWGQSPGSAMPGQSGRCTALAAGGHMQLAGGFVAALFESEDCNNDGIADNGQILRGELADANGDGIPDVCQGPTCRDADLFRDGQVNGADLAALLSQWGPANANTVSDINHDGVVDGFDLGLLLSFWGPCGN
jgi:hypothetical protein